MKIVSQIVASGLVMCVLAATSFVGAQEPTPTAAPEQDDYYELMSTFADTFEQIERNYVSEVDRKELMQAAIEGMVKKLDRYSNYIDPDELKAFNESVEQEFGGIGIQVEIDRKTGRLLVSSPLPGTPAYNGGIKAGDLIMEIEGESTEGFSIRDAQKLLKGRPGEPVTVGIQHADAEEIVQIPLVRALIQVSTVMGDHYTDKAEWDYMLNKDLGIGYIRLTHFSSRSADELRHALEILKGQGLKGLIIDLRYNPGGLLSQAIEIADMFIEEGTIVSTKGRNSPERSWSAHKEDTYTGFPMAVLINRYSASASEILSACLQDHKRAVVIGERSWGKGSVQNVIPLNGETSALKLTTASYHRPSGKNIHRFPGAKEEDEWGVMPDENFLHQMTREELEAYAENRRSRDVLDDAGPPMTDFVDPHLRLAIDYLQSKLEAGTEEKASEESEPKSETPATDSQTETP